MHDPYSVLGVSPSASDEEIKQAYRALAKKYHPDNYTGSPLSDLAGEKMSEINAAYDIIQEERRNGGPTVQRTYTAPGQSRHYATGGPFDDIRRLLSIGRVHEADELLNGTPTHARDAEWNFLKGSVLYRRGFLEDAIEYLQTAVRMAPQNLEYQSTYQTVLNRRHFSYSGRPVSTVMTCPNCMSCCYALLCFNGLRYCCCF